MRRGGRGGNSSAHRRVDLDRVSAHSLNALARFISNHEYRHASITTRVCVVRANARARGGEKERTTGREERERVCVIATVVSVGSRTL